MPLVRILLCLLIPALASQPEAPVHRVIRTEPAHQRILRKPGAAGAVIDQDGKLAAVHKTAKVDCRWEDWREWSVCQFTCGEGIAVRTRKVKTSASADGRPCDGDLKQERPCREEACPVDCTWDSWSSWSVCSSTCGTGTQTIGRQSSPARHGGARCQGNSTLDRQCNNGECSVDCQWATWSEWFACSKSCGGGNATRYRQVSIPKSESGQDCRGAASESKACSPAACPADCQFTEWETWSACSVTCGQGGTMTRGHAVLSPAANGGRPCDQLTQKSPCTGPSACGLDCIWSDWGEWKACTASCGFGTRARFRFEANPAGLNGKSCAGPKSEKEQCENPACEVDCQATPWTDWSPCSFTCGNNGLQERTRTITSAVTKGGRPCLGGNSSYEKKECTLNSCPVDCEWADWDDWRGCSTSCGAGSQLRLRMVKTQPSYGGQACRGNNSMSRACGESACPVPCTWNAWTEWPSCPVTCGTANITRSRTHTAAAFGGLECSGPSNELTDCHEIDCPVDCRWSDWSPWQCATSCAPGLQKRNRTILEVARDGGATCHGPDHESSPCSDLPTCPVDCKWTEWEDWSVCSATCGQGARKRVRSRAAYASFGGHNCYGTEDDEGACEGDPCPSDCVVGDWGPWAACPVTCGNGTRTRGRGIKEQARLGGGDCKGPFTSNKTCCNEACPVDCIFSDWTDWTSCSSSCGGGIRDRNRQEYQSAANGGRLCEGGIREDQACSEQRCPVDCHWHPWSEWGGCSKTCGGGVKTQSRTKTLAMFGGNECDGNETKQLECAAEDCPVDCAWEPWTAWENCTKSCNAGTTTRLRRKTQVEAYGGSICLGTPTETKACNTQGCPQDCLWSTWSRWTACSKDCGGGKTKRFRDVIQTMKNHGQNCLGDDQEEVDCNAQHCPLVCSWEDWSDWTACDISCNGGQRTRSRAPQQKELYGGSPCVGDATQRLACNLTQCPIDCVLTDWSEWGSCSVSCGSGTRFQTRTRMEGRYGGAACVGGLVNSDSCFSTMNDEQCPTTTVTTTQAGNIDDLLDGWIQSRSWGKGGESGSWDPEEYKGSQEEGAHNATVKPHAANATAPVPCTQEQVTAELAKYDESKLTEKLVEMQADSSWKRQGKAVSAQISGELVIYASIPDVLIGSGGVKFGLERMLARLAGVDSGAVTVKLAVGDTTGTSANQQKSKGNVIAYYNVYTYKDDKTSSPESVSKNMAKHDATAVTREIQTQLSGVESTFTALSMSLRVTRAPPSAN